MVLMYKARLPGPEEDYRHDVMTNGVATNSNYLDLDGYRRGRSRSSPGRIHIEDPFLFERNGKIIMLEKDMNAIFRAANTAAFAPIGGRLHWQMRRGSYPMIAASRRGRYPTEYYKMERPCVLLTTTARRCCMYFASTPTIMAPTSATNPLN